MIRRERWLGWIRTSLAAGLAMLWVTGVAAEDFQIRNWDVEDGLPDGTVTSMVQGPDGCLWVGTPSGVVRFDGAGFRRLDGLPERGISGLTFDEDGALWIAGKTGVVIRRPDGRIEPARDEAGAVLRADAGTRQPMYAGPLGNAVAVVAGPEMSQRGFARLVLPGNGIVAQ